MPHRHPYVEDDNNIDASTVADLYAEAEAALKKIERQSEAMHVPTLNQLRYAGCHITRYIRDIENNKHELAKAANHCKRATYDVYETGITVFLLKLNKFITDYESVVITDVISEWTNDLQTIRSIRNFVYERDENSRGNHYKICEEHYDNLEGIVAKAIAARSELNKLIKRRRMQIIMFVASLIVLLIAVLGFFGIKDIYSFSSQQKTSKPAIVHAP